MSGSLADTRSELVHINSSPYTDFFNRISPDDNMNNVININNTIDINEIKTDVDSPNFENQIINRNIETNEDYDNDSINQNVEVNENIINFEARFYNRFVIEITARRLNFDDCIDENMAEERDLNQLEPIDLREIEQLADMDECCSICLEHYETNLSIPNVCRLECSHHFHVNCLSQWLVSHHNCPLCRTGI